LDSLITLVWKKPAFFIAHPRAIAAFGRECTRRGVPPVMVHLFGAPFMTWRGIPIVPSDKVEIRSKTRNPQGPGLTDIILVRVGEQEQGVIGLFQKGLQYENHPSLNVVFNGIGPDSIANYLLSLYYSCVALTEDAIAVLENVEIGYFHDYAADFRK
ncbi:MAG: Crp/Fnr family transcriptional regulator, partial [Candidatus Kapabacteria bacterium]|nr:Crp/Fnr family transcriptional regulator [Candidatus Kapabacteria bacterium]